MFLITGMEYLKGMEDISATVTFQFKVLAKKATILLKIQMSSVYKE